MAEHYITKDLGLQVKDIDSVKGIVTGYFSAFDIKDSDGDVIRKGAYAKSISERGPKSTQPRIKHLLDHNTTQVIGKLLELEEDSYGLKYVSQLGTHTLGKDALKMIQEGLVTEHSVGFRPVRQHKKDDYNEMVELNLFEGSSLQFYGANQHTPIVDVKSLLQDNPHKLFERFDRLTKALRSGTYSDETFELLEIEQNQIKQAIKETLTVAPVTDHPAAEPVAKDADLIQLFRKELNLS